MMLTLETERLRLRPFREEDAEEMYRSWTSDPEVSKFLNWNTHKDIEETRGLLRLWAEEYKKPERINFAIELKEDGRLIGGIDVVGYLDGVPVIGYNLAKKYWGQGYMTEACRCVLGYLFGQGFSEIRIDAVRENTGSVRVIEKCGGELLRTEEEFIPAKEKTFFINRYIVRRKV
ncbi:MAG: GNAT family N-acetyltransferase [Ruminococcus sp.]|nr:GNAT family N-acetyltransferase [Ruminococcus sp.]